MLEKITQAVADDEITVKRAVQWLVEKEVELQGLLVWSARLSGGCRGDGGNGVDGGGGDGDGDDGNESGVAQNLSYVSTTPWDRPLSVDSVAINPHSNPN